MTTTDWLVIAGAVVLIAAVNWWFFVAGNSRATPVAQPPQTAPTTRDRDGGAS